MPVHIGVDFDNTIVCYDGVFHRTARELGLIPDNFPVDKRAVRDHLRQLGREDAWTELQGTVYGTRMADAAAFPGVTDFFLACRQKQIAVSIISHKTRHAVVGPQHDLHKSALDWLEQDGFFDPRQIGLSRGNVFFELTRAAKLERIRACGVSHFIDDLPEVLEAPGFPEGVRRILFAADEPAIENDQITRVNSWQEIRQLLAI